MGLESWKRLWWSLPRGVRQGLAGLVGVSVVGIGILMLVTPGPGILVIPFGLSILAVEFAWVRRSIRRWLPEAWQPEFVRDREPGPG